MDLNLYPLARTSGQDQANLPGMYIPEPPRRTARGRSQDRLALYLTLEGNASPPAEQMEQLLKRLSHTYYNTIGSVTAAMRAVAESLNQFLLERNLRGSSSGRQAIGILTILTLREERLVVGMCGPVQAFLVKSEAVEHYYDPQGSRRGLGLGRATPIFYAQAIIQPNDALVISPQPPATWTVASLAGLHGQKADLLRTSLLNQAGLDLNGLLVFASQGSGKISMLRPKP